MPIRVYINKVERLTEASNVEQLAEELALPGRGVALAVNNNVVPRGEWNEFALSEGDNVVIIKAAFGG